MWYSDVASQREQDTADGRRTWTAETKVEWLQQLSSRPECNIAHEIYENTCTERRAAATTTARRAAASKHPQKRTSRRFLASSRRRRYLTRDLVASNRSRLLGVTSWVAHHRLILIHYSLLHCLWEYVLNDVRVTALWWTPKYHTWPRLLRAAKSSIERCGS